MSGPEEPSSPTRITPLQIVALFSIAVLVHLPYLLRRPFFVGDDFGCLADADNLVRGTSRFFELPAWGVWRLGQRGFWLAEYSLFGLDPFPYHVVNVALHGVAVVLLARLLALAGAPRSRALLAGSLFAVLAGPSMTVRYLSVSAVIVAAIAVLVSLDAHVRARPVLAAAAILVGATFYEQALCAPAAMMLANVVLRRRPLWRGLLLPSAASVTFFAVNVWTLRGTAKVYAYNAGGTRALAQAVTAPLVSLGWNASLALGAAVLCGVLLLAAVARPARPLLPGLIFAWIAVVPMLGRNVNWSEWYFYLPAAGAAAAIALAFPDSRAWLWVVACVALAAWNLSGQVARSQYFVRVAEGYEAITRTSTPSREVSAAILVNVHSGLAWTAWQFGGSVRTFELWDSPDGRSRCYAGRDLGVLRARMRSEVPAVVLRSRFPEDLPPGMRGARAPARHELFPWPKPASGGK